MIFPSRELRWFYDDPTRPIGWGDVAAERTDWYAPIADGRSGVKLREGLLESKFLVQEGPTPPGLPDARPQQWTKASTRPPAEEAAVLDHFAQRHWLGVTKWRQLRRYCLEGEGARRVEPGVPGAVQAEWTEVRLHGRRSWTYGVEADAAIAWEDLERLALQVGQTLGLGPEWLGQTASFPEWLAERAISGQQATSLPTTDR